MGTPNKKIPCSVAIITRGEGLRPTLEALKDFEEIIICHGNPAPEHLEVAREYGAKLLRQYDTDEPGLTCVMDKAAVRQRAMEASTSPWRFFMDRDDRLSGEAIEEIRTITTSARPTHLVWRMRSRVFAAGKEIKHYGSYPAFQTRLVHESVGARFKGPVHERLIFDEKKYPVGTMHSFYDFHWPESRVKQYWEYLHTYAKRELQTMQYGGFGSFFYWGLYRRARILLGYLLWRLPAMYLRWGFKNSMPLSIELAIVRYHYFLLTRGVLQYLATRTWWVVFVETLRGKDINRILGNLAVRNLEAYGRVLDIGGREGRGSYWRYLRQERWLRKTTLDIDPGSKPDVVLDLERERLPFAKAHFDTVLLFNVLEHLKDSDAVLSNIANVLRPQGSLIGVIPFLVGVHPDPHDFIRYTDEGLRAALLRAGFSAAAVAPVGSGPFIASYYQSEFLWPRFIKLLLLPIIFGLDALILAMRPNYRHKFPLSYLFVATR